MESILFNLAIVAGMVLGIVVISVMVYVGYTFVDWLVTKVLGI